MTTDSLGHELLGAALGYAEQGYLVLPLTPNEKVPLGKLVRHGLRDASSDPERIRGWWGKEPLANIGVLCGPTSFDVLDVDGEEGARSLSALVERHADIVTRINKTPRGWHYLFKPGAFPTSAGKIAPGLDTRGDGTGYIVVPPSRTASGAVYREEVRAELAEAPPWLARLARGQAASRSQAEAKARVRGAKNGTRNVTLNREAFLSAMGSSTDSRAEAAVSGLVALSSLPEAEATRVGRRALREGLKAARPLRERYRRVPVMFPIDPRFNARTANAKLVAYTILAGSGSAAIPGVAVFRPRALAEAASLTEEQVRNAVRELSRSRLLRSDVRAGVYWLPEVTARFAPKTPNETRAWGNALKGYIPRCSLKDEIAAAVFPGSSWHSAALPYTPPSTGAGLVSDKGEGSLSRLQGEGDSLTPRDHLAHTRQPSWGISGDDGEWASAGN